MKPLLTGQQLESSGIIHAAGQIPVPDVVVPVAVRTTPGSSAVTHRRNVLRPVPMLLRFTVNSTGCKVVNYPIERCRIVCRESTSDPRHGHLRLGTQGVTARTHVSSNDNIPVRAVKSVTKEVVFERDDPGRVGGHKKIHPRLQPALRPKLMLIEERLCAPSACLKLRHHTAHSEKRWVWMGTPFPKQAITDPVDTGTLGLIRPGLRRLGLKGSAQVADRWPDSGLFLHGPGAAGLLTQCTGHSDARDSGFESEDSIDFSSCHHQVQCRVRRWLLYTSGLHPMFVDVASTLTRG